MSESNSNTSTTESAKQWKRVPFDIKLAKKIQSGEVEGRIVTQKGAYVRLLCTDRSSSMFPIVGLIGNCYIYTFTKSGVIDSNGNDEDCLFIELPEETPKHEFKPFDKVLVRNCEHEAWNARLYDIWFPELDLHGTQDNKEWKQCIPYEGNEHLVGTTNNPE